MRDLLLMWEREVAEFLGFVRVAGIKSSRTT